jgi:hypothetical protein
VDAVTDDWADELADQLYAKDQEDERWRPYCRAIAKIAGEMSRVGIGAPIEVRFECESDTKRPTRIRANFEGNRKSVIYLEVEFQGQQCRAWFGKSDSDSGGMYLHANSDEGVRELARFGKRFLFSGRRKLLVRYQRRGLGHYRRR